MKTARGAPTIINEWTWGQNDHDAWGAWRLGAFGDVDWCEVNEEWQARAIAEEGNRQIADARRKPAPRRRRK